jgi:poly-gamma-glutamate synthesis protein (capsule biosynthesis protein)
MVRPGSADELHVADLECPLTFRGAPIAKSGPHLRASPASASGIRKGGFDILTLANNHIMDMGEPGLEDTLGACASAGLKTVGAGRNLGEAARPVIADLNGMAVVVIACAEHEFSIAGGASAGAAPVDLIDNTAQIAAAKDRAEFVLVILHGGHEYFPLPSPRMVKLSRHYVEVGACAVIWHHGHTASGIELHRGSPIVYGTGNFLFDWKGPHPQAWYRGYLVELEVASGGVRQVRLVPYTQSAGHLGVRRMTTEAGREFLSEIEGYSRIIADEGQLHRSWEEFCHSKRAQYLSTALCLTRFERRLLRLGIWPFWRANSESILELLDFFTCESHREVTENVLGGEARKR